MLAFILLHLKGFVANLGCLRSENCVVFLTLSLFSLLCVRFNFYWCIYFYCIYRYIVISFYILTGQLVNQTSVTLPCIKNLNEMKF